MVPSGGSAAAEWPMRPQAWGPLTHALGDARHWRDRCRCPGGPAREPRGLCGKAHADAQPGAINTFPHGNFGAMALGDAFDDGQSEAATALAGAVDVRAAIEAVEHP